MDDHTFKRLLSEGESARLDFKSQQYAFADADDEAKSELLKDIMAMANASRELDAFILVGIKEQVGSRPTIVGITEHLDDAPLQQFINSKLNRPIEFSYSEFQSEGRTIGSIRIPVQRRPFFAKKRFGIVQPNSVYMRRGSATVIADPDEVHAMGLSAAALAKPSLRIEFANAREREKYGDRLILRPLVLSPLTDEELPRVPRPPGGLMTFEAVGTNYDYWKEMREYVLVRSLIGEVEFAVTNTSGTVADDVRVMLVFPAHEHLLVMDRLPRRPVKQRQWLTPSIEHLPTLAAPFIDLEKRGKNWHLEITFGKIQPGATVWRGEGCYLALPDGAELTLQGQMFGDNFEPIHVELGIASAPTGRKMTVGDLERYMSNGD